MINYVDSNEAIKRLLAIAHGDTGQSLNAAGLISSY